MQLKYLIEDLQSLVSDVGAEVEVTVNVAGKFLPVEQANFRGGMAFIDVDSSTLSLRPEPQEP